FRREVLSQFRFDENLTGYALGEDVEFCMRAGRRFRFGAYPAARWHHRRSVVGRPDAAEIRKMACASAAYLWRVHRRHVGDDLSYLWLLAGFGLERVLAEADKTMRQWIWEATSLITDPAHREILRLARQRGFRADSRRIAEKAECGIRSAV